METDSDMAEKEPAESTAVLSSAERIEENGVM